MVQKMFVDRTKKQHFISVAEQKLNAINPNDPRDKARVYSFDLQNRENYEITLSEPNTIKAEKNLYFEDLYTFEILSNSQRLCFEKLFHRLENNIVEHTNKILDENIYTVDIFLSVFKAKLMNMIRNPYCIQFTLNNFGELIEYHPVKADLLSDFNKISNYEVPKVILEEFLVSKDEYKQWLKILFLMFAPLSEERYFLDDIVDNFFNLEKFYHLIYICKYTNDTCLLSDRSYVNLSEIFDSSEGFSFGFNLRHDAFIYLTFLPNDLVVIAKNILGVNGENIAKILKESGVSQIQTSLSIQPVIDNIEILKSYNRHVIYQCYSNVFAASEFIKI